MNQATSVEDLTEAKVRAASVQLELLKEKIPGVYEGLVELAASLREENIEMFKMKAAAAQALGGAGINSDKAGDKAEVESRNAFALNVLKKVRIKLEGREPDPLRKSSVQEQGKRMKIWQLIARAHDRLVRVLVGFGIGQFVIGCNIFQLTMWSVSQRAWTILPWCTRAGRHGSDPTDNNDWTTSVLQPTKRRHESRDRHNTILKSAARQLS